MNIYNKKYALSWIENYESKGDLYRVKYLEPYLKKIVDKNPNSKILDIGCGWGTIPSFVKKQTYVGIDINSHFFNYIYEKFPNKNISLKKGDLPNNIGLVKQDFNLVICSMVLHTISNLRSSIKSIFSKALENEKVIIIDFNDSSEKKIRDGFIVKKKDLKKSIAGRYKLTSKVELSAEVYFHKEKEIEEEINKYAVFKKRKVGPLFVSYECRKIK